MFEPNLVAIARYLKLARTNAATALTSKLSQQSTVHQRLTALASVLKLPEVKRMECFDISHTMGEQTVASCVVFDANGPLRAEIGAITLLASRRAMIMRR
ncbi:hypothetical protein ACNKHM_24395 [Shigella sonnei]